MRAGSATMTSSFSAAAAAVVLLAVTSLRRGVSGGGGEVTWCPAECRCGLVSGAPSADCSGRQLTDLAGVVRQLHPDTQVCTESSRLRKLVRVCPTVISLTAFSRRIFKHITIVT